MIIDELQGLPGVPGAGDELPIERGEDVYKIDYDELAKAIISQVTPANIGAVSTSNIVNDLTATAANKVLDARQGKALKDLLDGRIYPFSIGSYSTVQAAAEAVWASMSGPTMKAGLVTVSSMYVYIAYVNAANTYGVCLMFGYNNQLTQIDKVNGNVNVKTYAYS